ncbi:hypothetical protein TMatcc_007586 [Talaromyces marneffei ATCC 18224]|uniref:Uncharacterized protein n=2 Tax=Talaromyces marneffei TaxID=37727 RepID=B6QG99_TALMQ|nr:uncharacterized protein EYB26_004531 [Talaromyces marneffei]EEA24484.1 conserved hypothetical protein [Talaromyces marneffei ATCC 18224]KAE8553008.1 hypothetical protein EYB25_004387 [Talaromyces marneffei]QGA16861.1 hypothetical protein EYB26_004531 [Talaromyces marneffei]
MPLPIIACGSANPRVFNAIQPLYLPEYEIAYHIMSSDSGIANIPFILQGQTSSVNRLNEDSSPPVAVCIGGIYTDEEIDAMHQACQGVSSVPWLRMDHTVPKPAVGPGYAEHVVKRIKDCMDKIKQEGKSDQDGIWFY